MKMLWNTDIFKHDLTITDTIMNKFIGYESEARWKILSYELGNAVSFNRNRNCTYVPR